MKIVSNNLNKMMRLCEREIPGFQVKFKDQSKLMKFLNFFVRIFNKRFMTSYTTVIGSTVYFSSEQYFYGRQEQCAETLAHELVHMTDRMKHGSVRFMLMYMSPQIFAVLALLAFGAFWNLWFLLALLLLACLAPLPSGGRRDLELRGYTMSMAVWFWKSGRLVDEDFEFVCEKFTGPDYYFMWPNKGLIMRMIKEQASNIRSGSVLQDPLFRKVHAVFTQE
jgi:hypothetical protein